jgi:quinol-cytochrome oxidoreductase complex cytochrome b subunit
MFNVSVPVLLNASQYPVDTFKCDLTSALLAYCNMPSLSVARLATGLIFMVAVLMIWEVTRFFVSEKVDSAVTESLQRIFMGVVFIVGFTLLSMVNYQVPGSLRKGISLFVVVFIFLVVLRVWRWRIERQQRI